MTPSEIKTLLSTYRNPSDCASDPRMAEALRRAEVDPELKQFLDDELAFDENFRSALNSIVPPQDLKSKIILDYHQNASSEEGRARFRWVPYASFAAAAAAMLLGIVNFTFINPPSRAEALQVSQASVSPDLSQVIDSAYSEFKSRGPRMISNDYSKLVSFLKNNGGVVPQNLPSQLEKDSSFACDVFNINGVKVGLICFNKDGQTFHLFHVAMPEDMISRAGEKPIIHKKDSVCCASWSDGKRFYSIRTESSEQKLRAVLDI